jgi:D-glycero-alpha-D-manno-heptose-7-phosphate kinase
MLTTVKKNIGVRRKLPEGAIVSRTPLRISFVGGGTDIPEYYRTNGGGAVVNAAIDKYVYVVVNKKFDGDVRVSYSQAENVSNTENLKHPLLREALKFLGIRKGIEIASLADIPSHGTGLGSSSTFTVGLLNALHAWLGEQILPKQLAEEAVTIEREIVKDLGGRQDQYIAAYGGLQFMEFHQNDQVDTAPILLREADQHALEESLLLFYTGRRRPSAGILAGQIEEMRYHWDCYNEMRQLALDLRLELEGGRVGRLGDYLHRNWELKRCLHKDISDSIVEDFYTRARKAGATGGKLTGAGGGGFLLLCVPPENHQRVRNVLPELKEEPFHLEGRGSQAIYLG